MDDDMPHDDAEAWNAWEEPPGVVSDDRPPEFSDEALALAFAEAHKNRLRYVAEWGKWLIWTGNRWRFDTTLEAFSLARATCRQYAARCEKITAAMTVASARTVAAVEKLAKADRMLAATVDQWDADPWVLNTPDGVIDLRTGDISPADPAAYMTKMTAVSLGDDCPLWRSFLHQITDGDHELQMFLQRIAGYSLTGITRDHALFFCYGTGGNGKGITLNTLTAIMADYAVVADMDTFTATRHDQHPTGMARLQGARFVTAQETEEGRHWAEARIKALTGADPITARFMNKDYFTFIPQFKLVIAGNHKPGLRSVDAAIRRRLHLVPFMVKITDANRDPELANKLKSEWPGILRWAVDGCLLWQEHGLNPPQIVASATEEYMTSEDVMGQWLEQDVTQLPTHSDTVANLFASWSAYADASGETAGSLKRFSQAMQSRGFKAAMDSRTRRAKLEGLSVKPQRGEYG